jgi:hypothetical protein
MEVCYYCYLLGGGFSFLVCVVIIKCIWWHGVGRNVEGERSLVYCERRNTQETEVARVGIEPLTKGKIKWRRVPTLPAVLLVAAN